MQGPGDRDDLTQRLSTWEDGRRRQRPRGDRVGAPRAERGQKEGQKQDRRKESRQEEARSVPLGAPSARTQPLDLAAVAWCGRALRHRRPGSGRSHGRHHSRPCRKLPMGSATIGTMSENPRVRAARWVQLVVLPVMLLLAGALGHAIFLFLTASVIAFLLNPLVRELQGLRIRRGIGVAVVYLTFAAAVIALIVALGTVVVEQTRSASDRVDAYLTDEPGRSGDSAFDGDVADFEEWLRGHGIDVELRDQVDSWLADVNVSDLTQEAISFAEGAAFGVVQLLFSIILIVVISVYMLLDMPKLERGIDRRFPPHDGPPLTLRIESALAGYVRGQLLLSTIIGTSA